MSATFVCKYEHALKSRIYVHKIARLCSHRSEMHLVSRWL